MNFMEKYQKLLDADKKITQDMLAAKEIDEDEAYFRDWMREDEILYDMINEN